MDIMKRGEVSVHPSAHIIQSRTNISGKFRPAVGMLMANFDPPMKGAPTTLKYQSVLIFFHEFGHIMHQMSSRASVSRFSGVSVEKDFVEMPSTLLENWMEDPTILQKMSKHVQTGAKIPISLIERKLKAIKFERAPSELWTLLLSTLDLLMWTAKDEKMLALQNDSIFNN